MEPSAERARPPSQIDQIHFAVVVENDFVVERRFRLRARFQLHAVENSIDIAQRFHVYLEPERNLERAFPCPRPFQLDLVAVSVHAHKNLRHGNVLLGVEILGQFLIAEHLIAHQNSLARINPAKTAAGQRPAAHRYILAAVIF